MSPVKSHYSNSNTTLILLCFQSSFSFSTHYPHISTELSVSFRSFLGHHILPPPCSISHNQWLATCTKRSQPFSTCSQYMQLVQMAGSQRDASYLKSQQAKFLSSSQCTRSAILDLAVLPIFFYLSVKLKLSTRFKRDSYQ